MTNFPASHPIWSIIRLTILMASLVLILYLTASKFDETELRTIITMFVIGSGAETLGFFIAKKD